MIFGWVAVVSLYPPLPSNFCLLLYINGRRAISLSFLGCQANPSERLLINGQPTSLGLWPPARAMPCADDLPLPPSLAIPDKAALLPPPGGFQLFEERRGDIFDGSAERGEITFSHIFLYSFFLVCNFPRPFPLFYVFLYKVIFHSSYYTTKKWVNKIVSEIVVMTSQIQFFELVIKLTAQSLSKIRSKHLRRIVTSFCPSDVGKSGNIKGKARVTRNWVPEGIGKWKTL